MKNKKSYDVVLFKTVSHTIKAEKILRQKGLPYKLIPTPKQISTDCGVCLMIDHDLKDEVVAVLQDAVDIENVCPLGN